MTAVRAVEVGTELPPLKIGPISRTTLALFAGASGDRDPMRIDIDVARSAGLDDVFAQGMLSMAYLGRLLTNWVDPQAIRHYRVRFAAITPLHGAPNRHRQDHRDRRRRRRAARDSRTRRHPRGRHGHPHRRRRRRAVTPSRGNHPTQRKGLSTMGTLEGKVALVSGSGRGIGGNCPEAGVRRRRRRGERPRSRSGRRDRRPHRGRRRPGGGLQRQRDGIGVCRAVREDGRRHLRGARHHHQQRGLHLGQRHSEDDRRAVGRDSRRAPEGALPDPSRRADFIRAAAKKEADEGRPVYRKVVNISSVSGTSGNAGQANYSSAKAGINGLTRALAKEWGRYRVNVNSVAFGMIQTRLTEATADGSASIDVDGRQIKVGVNPDIVKFIEKLIPLGRAGTAEEAAGAVYLLCIPESNYVSGEVLVCGGGFFI